MPEIVIGYDGSDCAKTALDEAVALAKELGDSVLIVFGFAPGGPGGGEVQAQRDAVKELGERRSRGGRRKGRRGRRRTRGRVASTSTGADALSDSRNELDARMIVVGTKGESPFKGAILGSTAHRLIQIASRPVLVVRRETA